MTASVSRHSAPGGSSTVDPESSGTQEGSRAGAAGAGKNAASEYRKANDPGP